MKRNLTPSEIEYICSDITPTTFFPDISITQVNHVTNYIKKELQNKLVYPEIIEELKQKITRYYYKTLVEPGENCGIIAAQSISEKQTQLVLNSFHTSGAATNTTVSGVTRFTELLNATKKPKQTITYLSVQDSDKYRSLQHVREEFCGKISHVSFKDIIQDIKTNTKHQQWYKSYFLLTHHRISKEYDYCVSFILDITKRIEHKLSLAFITQKLENSINDIECIYSPDVYNTIDVWFNSQEIEIPVECSEYIDEKNKLTLYIYDILIPNLSNVSLCGITGMSNIQIYKHKLNNDWIIETIGNNLVKCCQLQGINPFKTWSNNMWEIYELLGIEATREFLVQEFINVIASDSYINVRHIELLVDTMLHLGTITSISRYGMKTNSSGPLTKSSFETSLDQFLKAGIYSDCETTNGVSAAVMVGKRARTGTGLCDLLYKQ